MSVNKQVRLRSVLAGEIPALSANDLVPKQSKPPRIHPWERRRPGGRK